MDIFTQQARKYANISRKRTSDISSEEPPEKIRRHTCPDSDADSSEEDFNIGAISQEDLLINLQIIATVRKIIEENGTLPGKARKSLPPAPKKRSQSKRRKVVPDKSQTVDEASACDICGKMFHKPYAVKRHKSSVHDKLARFSCDVCSYTCYRRDVFNHHVRRHTKN